jgi:hypothetical protein
MVDSAGKVIGYGFLWIGGVAVRHIQISYGGTET